MMLFVQHFLSVDFAFCTYSQDLLFWSKRNVSAVWGCVHVRVCMCVGVHIVENKLENTYLTFSPFPLEVEIKWIFSIVTFLLSPNSAQKVVNLKILSMFCDLEALHY